MTGFGGRKWLLFKKEAGAMHLSFAPVAAARLSSPKSVVPPCEAISAKQGDRGIPMSPTSATVGKSYVAELCYDHDINKLMLFRFSAGRIQENQQEKL